MAVVTDDKYLKPYYSSKKSPVTQALLWLLPTAVEVTAYIILALLTLVLSNIDFINEFLLIPPDFNLKTAILGSIEDVLAQLIGQQAAATVITGLFWGIIGMLVYIFLWLFGNFSTELSNNLAISKYYHPKGADRFSPLKGLLFRILFQFCIAILLCLYINLIITVLLPLWATKYSTAIDTWPNASTIGTGAWTLLSQITALHILAVLFRLMLMRKRVFGINNN